MTSEFPVKELIEELQQYPPDLKVVMSSDPEGNSFHLFQDIGYGRWVPDRPDREYYGEFTSWAYDDDDTERAMTLDESDAVCLWP